MSCPFPSLPSPPGAPDAVAAPDAVRAGPADSPAVPSQPPSRAAGATPPTPDRASDPAPAGAGCPAASPVPELFGPGFAADPYPAYARLRESAPVHRVTLPSGVSAWLVTRWEDARRTLADPRLSKNPDRHGPAAHERGRVGIPGERGANLMTHLLNIDPPDHTRLRRLVSAAFTPRRVAAFAPRVEELTHRLIDGFAPRGSADLIHEFAFPLPIYAICDLLGVPEEDHDDFRDWAGMMLHTAGRRGGVGRAVKRMRTYLSELIDRKRAEPGDDLITALIRASDHGEHLTGEEAAAMSFILLFAGFETTVNLIGNGTYALLRHPDQLEYLRGVVRAGDEAAVDRAVEELLRWDGPVEMATWRFARESLTIGGQRIAAGDPVLVVLAAADRDPARFPAPDRLDLTRSDQQHLGYGHGIHYCLGAPLARLEGRIALSALLTRLPDLRLAADPEELRWRGGLIMRGLRTLPVDFRRETDLPVGNAPSVL
ncbi:cytochrome P450 [Streptomyces calidiresistens]